MEGVRKEKPSENTPFSVRLILTKPFFTGAYPITPESLRPIRHVPRSNLDMVHVLAIMLLSLGQAVLGDQLLKDAVLR